MSRVESFVLALIVAAAIAVGVPFAAALWQMLLERVNSLGMFWYSTLLACVALPFMYAILRRMK